MMTATRHIDKEILRRSMERYDINPLYQELKGIFGEAEADRLCKLYSIGTASKWGGSTVYWYIDKDGDAADGVVVGRGKEADRLMVSKLLGMKDYCQKNTFFGEQLLSVSPQTNIIIVESERTCLIGNHFMPDYLWIATGRQIQNGGIDHETATVLENRNVTLFPNLGTCDYWKPSMQTLESVCKSVTLCSILEDKATEAQRLSRLDIADFLLMQETRQMVLQRMIARNPCLQKLIDAFDLELVDED